MELLQLVRLGPPLSATEQDLAARRALEAVQMHLRSAFSVACNGQSPAARVGKARLLWWFRVDPQEGWGQSIDASFCAFCGSASPAGACECPLRLTPDDFPAASFCLDCGAELGGPHEADCTISGLDVESQLLIDVHESRETLELDQWFESPERIAADLRTCLRVEAQNLGVEWQRESGCQKYSVPDFPLSNLLNRCQCADCMWWALHGLERLLGGPRSSDARHPEGRFWRLSKKERGRQAEIAKSTQLPGSLDSPASARQQLRVYVEEERIHVCMAGNCESISILSPEVRDLFLKGSSTQGKPKEVWADLRRLARAGGRLPREEEVKRSSALMRLGKLGLSTRNAHRLRACLREFLQEIPISPLLEGNPLPLDEEAGEYAAAFTLAFGAPPN